MSKATNKLNNNIANDFKTNVIEYYNTIKESYSKYYKPSRKLNQAFPVFIFNQSDSIISLDLKEDWFFMIQEAKNANIPIMENPYLANLLEGVDIGEEVPESLYTSIAVVLSWVFWLRGDKPF